MRVSLLSVAHTLHVELNTKIDYVEMTIALTVRVFAAASLYKQAMQQYYR